MRGCSALLDQHQRIVFPAYAGASRPQKGMSTTAFDPNKHPRDIGGRFAKKGYSEADESVSLKNEGSSDSERLADRIIAAGDDYREAARSPLVRQLSGTDLTGCDTADDTGGEHADSLTQKGRHDTMITLRDGTTFDYDALSPEAQRLADSLRGTDGVPVFYQYPTGEPSDDTRQHILIRELEAAGAHIIQRPGKRDAMRYVWLNRPFTRKEREQEQT